MAQVGGRWPASARGEVVGPSGSRCHTPGSAASILGVTERTVRNWIRAKKHVELVLDQYTGRKVRFFLLADGVEALAAQLDRWPPSEAPLPEGADVDAWGELWVQQGHDLDHERKARAVAEANIEMLRAEVQSLRRRMRALERQRAELSKALSATAAAAEIEFASESAEDL